VNPPLPPQASPDPEQKPKTSPAHGFADKTLTDILKGLLGRVVTFVNAESFEEGASATRSKRVGTRAGMGKDYLFVITEFRHGTGKKSAKEPVRQYVPFDKMKRSSVMKSQILVHI
jgi:hypothetical protein